MRIFFIPVFAIFLCLPAAAAMAADSDMSALSGNPVILPSGMIMIEGHKVTLWGIDALAHDQQCWHENVAWDCGEQALMALRHHLTGHSARCVVKSDAGGATSAQCFRKTGDHEDDVARWLVAQGWARNDQDVTDGLYADDESNARQKRRGIWTSRFQTAEDWKNGVPHYVNYTPAPPAQPHAAADGTQR